MPQQLHPFHDFEGRCLLYFQLAKKAEVHHVFGQDVQMWRLFVLKHFNQQVNDLRLSVVLKLNNFTEQTNICGQLQAGLYNLVPYLVV
jgi:hypothetical protein